MGIKLEPGLRDYPLKDLKEEGFEYGYGGSGCRNLAFAILANLFGEVNLTRNELEWYPFLSKKLSLKFMEEFVSRMPKTVRSHELGEEVIWDWLKDEFPSLNVQDYEKRRDAYRENLRLYDALETELAGEVDVLPYEEFSQKRNTWRKASEEIAIYEDWINSLFHPAKQK